MKHFKEKTIIITGASRGIGREFAIRLGELGANVVLAAKTREPHQTLEGTILSVAEEVKAKGGQALPIQIDVRDDLAIPMLVEKTIAEFGCINGLINNAGAIYLTDTLSTEAKQFDLMHSINVRATFLMSRACIPHIAQQGGHVLNLSPPIDLDSRWLSPHVAYTISKYGMSMCTLAMSEEFKEQGVAVNSLWPKMIIYTAAVKRLLGDQSINNCRTPAIMADAALHILKQEPHEMTGNLFLDEDVVKMAGVTDLSKYDCVKNPQLLPDLYVS